MSRPSAGQLAQTCLMVRDLDRSLALYHGLLGMPIVEVVRRDPPARAYAALGTPENYLEIFERRPEEGPLPERAADQPLGLHHLAVWVEDLEGLAARLAAAGYPLTGPIRSVSRWVGAALRVAWIEDPDGVKIELLEYVGPAGD